jgi:putative ABC transport system substrate-binding protein
MYYRRFIPVLIALSIGILFTAYRSTAVETGMPYRVFILHSYEQNHVCGQPQHDGVVAALKKDGFVDSKNLILKSYYMDTKRKNNTKELMNQQADRALKLIKEFQPHVMVTLDDNAFRTVALKLIGAPFGIVYSGLNGQPGDYNKQKKFFISSETPGYNVTGVYEKLHLVEAIRVQDKIIPNLRKVRMLCDVSPTGRAVVKQVQIELAQGNIPVDFDMKVIHSWEEYKREIATINESDGIGTIYPAALLLKDSKGTTYTAPEIFRWTVQNCRKPAIAVNYAFVRLGLFGGAAVDFKSMGMQAGTMVARILKGQKAGTIAFEDARRYALVFNLARAKQLNIVIPDDILLAADDLINECPQ